MAKLLVIVGGALLLGFWLWSRIRDQKRARGVAQLRRMEGRFARAMLEGDLSEARRVADDIAEVARGSFGEHPDTVKLLLRAAFMRGVDDDPEASAELQAEALAMAKRLPSQDRPVLAKALMDTVGGFRGRGDLEASRFHWERAVEVWEELAAKNADRVQCHSQLTQIYDALDDPDAADAHMRKAYELALDLPEPPPFVRSNYAYRRMRSGDLDEARRVCDALRAVAEDKGEDLGSILALQMRIHSRAGEHDQAVAIAREQLERAPDGDEGYSLNLLAEALRGAEAWDEAIEVAERWLALQVDAHGENAYATSSARMAVARARHGGGDEAGAREAVDRAIDVIESSLEENDSELRRRSLKDAEELRHSIARPASRS